jgi:hypothetical protein
VRRAWGGLGVREVVLCGALVDTEKMKKKKHTILFFNFIFGCSGCNSR